MARLFALSLALTFLSSIAQAAPVNAIQAGSKHNLYLVTCARPATLLSPVTTFTAAAYFANGPVEAGSRNKVPTQSAAVTDPAQPWEGVTRAANLALVGVFSSSIDANATTLAKGQIAGSATLGTEEFVCFTDGATTFESRSVLGAVQYACVAYYWCPSIA